MVSIFPLLLGWHDVAEIICFSWIIYSFSAWISKDRQKSLLPAFYGYSLALGVTYFASLQTLNQFLLICAPIAVMLLIVVHQQTLQKNFIALKNITPTYSHQTDWLETLMRTSLIATNSKKNFLCVIERGNALINFLTTPLMVHADVQQGLLAIIIESNAFNPERMIWLNAQGNLLGINATLAADTVPHEWVADEVKALDDWRSQAIIITAKTDALVFNITPNKKTFDLAIGGNMVENVNATQMLMLLKKYLYPASSTKQGEIFYGKSENYSTEQRQP